MALYEYRSGNDVFEGYIAYPADALIAPCVLIVHDWNGCGEPTHRLADAIAQLGYVAFAVDMYGKGKRGGSPEASATLMEPLVANRALIHQRLQVAISVAKDDRRVDERAIAAIGHCFGGLCVLDGARRNLELLGVVSVHGVLTPLPESTGRVGVSVLILHGNEDPLAPPTGVAAISDELTNAGADWQLHVFGHAMHAFTVPAANQPHFGLLYDKVAAKRAWALMVAFLAETFGSEPRLAAA
jgi:dienelactone hydrolase